MENVEIKRYDKKFLNIAKEPERLHKISYDSAKGAEARIKEKDEKVNIKFLDMVAIQNIMFPFLCS